MVGIQTAVGLTKSDRQQCGEVKGSPCPSNCPKEVKIGDDGLFDVSELCQNHLMLYYKKVQASSVGVDVKDMHGPVWSDVKRFEAVRSGTLVADDEHSPLYAKRNQMRVPVLTRAEERVSGKKSGLWFSRHQGSRMLCMGGATIRQSHSESAGWPFAPRNRRREPDRSARSEMRFGLPT